MWNNYIRYSPKIMKKLNQHCHCLGELKNSRCQGRNKKQPLPGINENMLQSSGKYEVAV